MTETTYEPGDVVIDRDDPTPNRAVVVNIPETEAHDWNVGPRECTVAEDNQDYPRDDPVVVVCFESELVQAFPWWTGWSELPFWKIKQTDAYYYSFPESRLEQVDSYGPLELPVDKLNPSPYSTREFDPTDHQELIADLRAGDTYGTALATVTTDGFELVNGHKRVWAAEQAGLDTYPVHIHYFEPVDATRYFLEAHFTAHEDDEQDQPYTHAEKEASVAKVRERWGQQADDFEHVVSFERQELEEIVARFEESGAEVEISDGAVEVTKLGDTYRVRADGTVESDGPLKDRIEAAAREAV